MIQSVKPYKTEYEQLPENQENFSAISKILCINSDKKIWVFREVGEVDEDHYMWVDSYFHSLEEIVSYLSEGKIFITDYVFIVRPTKENQNA